MKSLFNLRTLLFAITITMIAGCSGITETSLPDVDEPTLDATSGQVTHQELPDYINYEEDQKTPIIERAGDAYEDKE